MFDQWREKLKGLFGVKSKLAANTQDKDLKKILITDLFDVIRPIVSPAQQQSPKAFVDAYATLLKWMDGGIKDPSSYDVLAFKIPLSDIGFSLEQKVLHSGMGLLPEDAITVPLKTLQELKENLHILDEAAITLNGKDAEEAIRKASLASENVAFISPQAQRQYENLHLIFDYAAPDGESWTSIGSKLGTVYKNLSLLLNKYDVTNRVKIAPSFESPSTSFIGTVRGSDDFTF